LRPDPGPRQHNFCQIEIIKADRIETGRREGGDVKKNSEVFVVQTSIKSLSRANKGQIKDGHLPSHTMSP